MATRLSTGLVTQLLDTGSIKSIFSTPGFFIDIYSGAQPSDADAAPTGTKLVTIYSDGAAAALHLAASASAGSISKLGSETWSGTVSASGTAGWFRLRLGADGGASSTNDPRIDGAIATSGQQMQLSVLTLTSGAPFVLPSGALTLPKA